jgi:hypothetical protein
MSDPEDDCPLCLTDRHYCPQCDNAVSHFHVHEEDDENPGPDLITITVNRQDGVLGTSHSYRSRVYTVRELTRMRDEILAETVWRLIVAAGAQADGAQL